MLDDNLIKITQTIEIFKFRNFKLLKITRTRSNPPFTRKQILSSRKENAQEKKEEGGDETSPYLTVTISPIVERWSPLLGGETRE